MDIIASLLGLPETVAGLSTKYSRFREKHSGNCEIDRLQHLRYLVEEHNLQHEFFIMAAQMAMRSMFPGHDFVVGTAKNHYSLTTTVHIRLDGKDYVDYPPTFYTVSDANILENGVDAMVIPKKVFAHFTLLLG